MKTIKTWACALALTGAMAGGANASLIGSGTEAISISPPAAIQGGGSLSFLTTSTAATLTTLAIVAVPFVIFNSDWN